MTIRPGEAERLGTIVGGHVVAAEPARWGFSNRTTIVTLAGGERRVVSEFADWRSGPFAVRLVDRLGPRLRQAGIPAPAVLRSNADARPAWTVSAFVDGTIGADLVSGDAAGAEIVGRLLGELASRLRSVDTTGVRLSGTWSRPERLAALAGRWAASVADSLDAPERRAVDAAVDRLPALLAGRPAVFAHGDLAPVNLVVRDGRAAALLDYEHARLADVAFDPAWFRWIVATHHPTMRWPAWGAFEAAAGLPRDATTAELLETIPIVRLLEAIGRGGPDDRARRAARIRMLRATLPQRSPR